MGFLAGCRRLGALASGQRDTCAAHTHPVQSATPLTTSRLSRNAEDWVVRRL